jgi:hypothetical protein
MEWSLSLEPRNPRLDVPGSNAPSLCNIYDYNLHYPTRHCAPGKYQKNCKPHLNQIATIADIENNLYLKQYKECEQLYNQGKYTECTSLALYNMTDLTMPRYVEIKTLILLVGAENDSWKKAEV